MILLGDLHLGTRKYDRTVYTNQIKYLKRIIDISAKEDKIIWQLGDIFDSRQTTDILFLHQVKELFEYLAKKDVKLYTLLGNHDIFYKESREVSLVQHFERLFPKNFIVYKERDVFEYNDKKIYIVPWIVKGESLKKTELKNMDLVFGHFEIYGFEVVKGHMDERSVLSEKFFKDCKCPAYSGHYHLRNIKEWVKYIGTPYQLNWSDFNEKKGYYKLDEDLNLEFFENTEEDYPRHIKILYNDTNKDNPILVQGFKEDLYCDLDIFKGNIERLRGQSIKFFVNAASSQAYEEYLYILKENGVAFEFLNNQKISELIETNYVAEGSLHLKPSRELITDYLKENNPELMPIYLELLEEIKTQD